MNRTTKLKYWAHVAALTFGFTSWSASASARSECGAECVEPEIANVDCSTGCDRDIAGYGHTSVAPGEVVCVQPGEAYSGGLNISGGELRVCGTLSPSYVNFNAGDMTVLGEATIGWLNVNNPSSTLTNYGQLDVAGLGLQGSLVNHGTATLKHDLNLSSTASVYNTATLSLESNANNGGTLENAGDLIVLGNLNNNGGGQLDNACYLRVEGDVQITDGAHNGGQLFVVGSVTVNQEMLLGGFSLLQAGSLYVNGSLSGSETNCSAVHVSDPIVVNGSVTGKTDLCNGSGIQAAPGALGPDVTADCQCDPILNDALFLTNVQPEEIGQYACVDQVARLYISSSSFDDLTGFPELPLLEQLALNTVDLKSVEGLPELPNLATLYLSKNQLADLDGLPSLPALQYLYATSNPIVDAWGLAAAPALEWVNLTNSEIASVMSLPPLPNLRGLQLEHDGKGPKDYWAYLLLTDLDALSRFPNLEYLNMSGRLLTDLVGIPVLEKLETLRLNSNELTDVTGLPPQPALEYVELANNPVDLEVLEVQATALNLELCDYSYAVLMLPGQCW